MQCLQDIATLVLLPITWACRATKAMPDTRCKCCVCVFSYSPMMSVLLALWCLFLFLLCSPPVVSLCSTYMYELTLGLGLLTVLSLAHVAQVSLLLYTWFYPLPMSPSLLTVKHQETEGMDRFKCQGELTIGIREHWQDPTQLITKISMKHLVQHVTYTNISMPSKAINFTMAGIKYSVEK